MRLVTRSGRQRRRRMARGVAGSTLLLFSAPRRHAAAAAAVYLYRRRSKGEQIEIIIVRVGVSLVVVTFARSFARFVSGQAEIRLPVVRSSSVVVVVFF